MARSKHPLKENVEITNIGSTGKAVGRINEKVVFIPFAVPGDIVDVQITKKRKSYLEGRVVKFKKLSKQRIKPKCEHFGVCGGCKWQNLDYATQLRYKEEQVIANLNKFSNRPIPSPQKILGSANDFFYRNKLEYSFSNKKWLIELKKGEVAERQNMNGIGFHMPGMFDRILDLENCYLQKDPSNEIRLFIRDYAKENEISFYDIRQHIGLLRNLIIRNTSLGEWMIILVVSEDQKEVISNILNAVNDKFNLTSIYYVINDKMNDTIYDLDVHLFKGQPYITEKMEDLQFRISPKSFYQTNSEQAYELYNVVRKFANLKGDEIVYDLYTGTGTIANFIAGGTAKIIGIESVADAIIDAINNSTLNGINNTGFYSGDMLRLLTDDFVKKNGHPQLIITDPPRAGMHPKVIKQINKISPDRIIYVSCNAATQARDISLLDESYELKAVQIIDMFPQTHHVESVILLEKKTN